MHTDTAPITQHERTLDENHIIVSKTNPKGIITYCNRTFSTISGYSEEDLLGKPHNIVRHPHMPKDAFADLWTTIKKGTEWHGIVKNRCKNGDFYWVSARVTPSFDAASKLIGYMSIRRKAQPHQIIEATSIYQSMIAK